MFKTFKTSRIESKPDTSEIKSALLDISWKLFAMLEDEEEDQDEDKDCECNGIDLSEELLPSMVFDHETRIQDIEKILKKAKLIA
ncbi:MAG: hypothetical protein JWL88_242 [Parcubacteria group bacterium]|nr:hypothetical protein [Parcubacteria group bacterium]